MRRIAIASLVAGSLAVAGLTYVGMDQLYPTNEANNPTASPTPTRSANPATIDYQIVPANTASSFRVELGGKGLKGERYDVTFKRGELTSYKPNLASVAKPIPPSGFGNGNGSPLGRACSFDHKTAQAYPFSVSITEATTSLYPVFVSFDAHGVNSGRQWHLPNDRVQMEFADSEGGINCYTNLRGNHFRMPAAPKRAITMTGWIILQGEGTTKGLQLSITTNTPDSAAAQNTITKVGGEFKPYTVGTIAGRGRVVAGGTMPLMPNTK